MNKVHPVPRKRNITLRYDAASTLSEANRLLSDPSQNKHNKKLRRLPHIFAKVLELPFHSIADVLVEETPSCFRFSAATDFIGGGGEVRAQTIEIYPGVTKIVIRGLELIELSFDEFEFELDLWRFRLPECTRPEMATAEYSGGELVVVVPKGANLDEDAEDDGNDNGQEGNGRLVLVQ